MAGNPRINQDNAYANGVALPQVGGVPSYWRTLDTTQSQAVNGDLGGTWNPSAPIVLGGAGMVLCTTTHIFDQNPGVTTPLGSGARITFGDNDYYQIQVGSFARSRTIVTSLAAATDISSVDANPVTGLGSAPNFIYTQAAHAQENNPGNAAYIYGGRLIAPIRVQNGATFSSITIWFQVNVSHPNVPVSLPAFRIMAVDGFGNVTQLAQSSTLTGWIGDGFLTIPRPGSGAAYYNGGAAQSFSFVWGTTPPPFLTIDTSTYMYFVEIFDEGGANALTGTAYISVLTNFTSITDTRPG